MAGRRGSPTSTSAWRALLTSSWRALLLILTLPPHTLAFAAFKYRETLTKTVLQLVGRLIKRKR